LKLILIDTNDAALQSASAILRSAGYDVVTLASPLGAAAAIGQHHPAAILVELDMPALSGEKVAAIVKRQRSFAGVRVLLHSDRSDEELAAAAARCGADGFIRKTNNAEALVQAVKKHLT
jgi:two-component system, OmpR family, response regulator